MAFCGSFMETPLVTWVKTFKHDGVPVTYKDVSDGMFLNQVVEIIDPKAAVEDVNESVEDIRSRLHNWDILLKNIKAYYQDVLQQYIVMKLPNIATISKEPDSDKAKIEILQVLLLILGCAVQCEKKEEFIDNIKTLRLDVQHAIVRYIQEITDDTKNVFGVNIPEQHLDELTHSMLNHLRSLINERDSHVDEIKELHQTVDELQHKQEELSAQVNQKCAIANASSTPEKHHLPVELAECKARMRELRRELEEKTELFVDLQDELNEEKGISQKLRTENLQLTQDARAARTYRDELDIFKEKANKVEKYEAEITKYKEKLNELEFYKSRVEELREDNAILAETRNMLESKLDASHKRIEMVVDLEKELLKYKQHLQEMAVERDQDRQKIQNLVEENTRLEFEKKNSFNESATLEEELNKAKLQVTYISPVVQAKGSQHSISNQLNETANAKILRLELENQTLQKRLEEMKEKQLLENASRVLELEKENNLLNKKVEKLQESNSLEAQNSIELEQVTQDLEREKAELKETIETVKEIKERQVRQLERENEHLQERVQTLRERNEKTHDQRLQDTEKENKRLHDQIQHVTVQMGNLEFENRNLSKAHEQLKETVNGTKELDDKNQKLEKENDELRKTFATLQLTCDKLDTVENEKMEIELENKKMIRSLEGLKKTVTKLQTLEEDNFNLTVEARQLRLVNENMRNVSSKVADLELEKEELNREIQLQKKSLESSRIDRAKQEQLNLDLLDMDADNHKMQRTIEALERKANNLEQETLELESQNEKLHKTIENMQVSVRRLDEVEKEWKNLESKNTQLLREKSHMEKEKRVLRNSIQIKDGAMEDLTAKVSRLEKENKVLNKATSKNHDTESRVREVEKENQELIQSTLIDKRTLTTLREELVDEKIKSQQMTNEMGKLSKELEKVGLDRHKLVAAEQEHGESKYKALESLMKETYKETIQIKEDKIHDLESRLEQSKSRNTELQANIKSVKREHAALLQRREEEVLVSNRSPERTHVSEVHMYPNATKDILDLKDHLITVERTNAALESDNKYLKQQVESAQERLGGFESRNLRLQSKLSSLQGENNQLQMQLAKLQVENTTLQSQSTSLLSQNATFQKQQGDVESEHMQLINSHEELSQAHESLVTDHEALQQLHEQLSGEYEALISEHGSLKANHKSLRAEFKQLQDQHFSLVREQQTIDELKRTLERDRDSIQSESKYISNLQMDFVHLKEENLKFQNARDKVSRDFRDLQNEYKGVKTDYNHLKIKHTDLQGSYAECRSQLSTMDIEVSKMVNKYEALSQLNTKLEEENRQLMMQLQALLNQNQELLTQSLENKDQFAEEQKAYWEKLAELRRQKEKLEDKIMEQYKRYDPVKKKNRSFGANLVRKARAIVSKANRNKERSKTLGAGEISYGQDSLENSLRNSSFADSDDKKSRRRSTAMDGSPLLSKQNKSLAKSTTALNLTKTSESRSRRFSLRGAKSSENLLTTSPGSESFSSGNISVHNNEWPTRPSKRRQLMDSPSTGSSSKDYADGSYQQKPSTEKETKDSGLKLIPRDPIIADPIELISLNEFLQECNRSPKSRRKLLKEKKIDIESERTEGGFAHDSKSSTEVLSPELGPRSATALADDIPNDADTPRSGRLSDINLSQLSHMSSGSSISSNTYDKRDYNVDDRRDCNPGHLRYSPLTPQNSSRGGTDLKTSTPKYIAARDIASKDRELLYNAEDQTTPLKRDPGRQYNGYRKSSTDNIIEGVRSRNWDNEAIENAASRQMSPPRAVSSGVYNASHLTPQSSDHSKMDGLTRQSSASSVGSGSIGAYNATTGQTTAGTGSSWQSSSHNTVQQTPNPVTDNKYNSNSTAPHHSSQPHHINDLQYNRNNTAGQQNNQRNTDASFTSTTGSPSYGERAGPPQYRPPPPPYSTHRASSVPPENDLTSQYQPGNVRNLVQNFQKSVKQNPIIPPRKARPQSAGPSRSINSAFSLVPRSSTPGFLDNSLERSLPQTPSQSTPSGGRSLPQNPEERAALARSGGPGSTPPNPQQASGNDPPKKNSVWYEYGCV